MVWLIPLRLPCRTKRTKVFRSSILFSGGVKHSQLLLLPSLHPPLSSPGNHLWELTKSLHVCKSYVCSRMQSIYEGLPECCSARQKPAAKGFTWKGVGGCPQENSCFCKHFRGITTENSVECAHVFMCIVCWSERGVRFACVYCSMEALADWRAQWLSLLQPPLTTQGHPQRLLRQQF